MDNQCVYIAVIYIIRCISSGSDDPLMCNSDEKASKSRSVPCKH